MALLEDLYKNHKSKVLSTAPGLNDVKFYDKATKYVYFAKYIFNN